MVITLQHLNPYQDDSIDCQESKAGYEENKPISWVSIWYITEATDVCGHPFNILHEVCKHLHSSVSLTKSYQSLSYH